MTTQNTNNTTINTVEDYEFEINELWSNRWESKQDSVAAQQHDLSLTHGEGVSSERFRWIEDRRVGIQIWDLEQRMEWIRETVKESKALRKEVWEDKNLSGKDRNRLVKQIDAYRDKVWQDMLDINSDLDWEGSILLSEEENDEEYRGRNVTSWERGEALMYWLKDKAKDMAINELVRWNIRVNKRRKMGSWDETKTQKNWEQEQENIDYKLSFVHYVGCKIVIERQLAKKYVQGTRAQVRAKESYERNMEMWEQYNLANRLEGTATCEFDGDVIDPDAAYFGRPGLVHQRYVEMIDMKRISEDETVLQGYLLSCEAGNMNLPQGTDNVSIATAIIAMVRAKGVQAEAARMVNMPYSTFRYRMKQARKALEQKLDSNELSSSEYNAFRSMIG
jgi:hypothetical protein